MAKRRITDRERKMNYTPKVPVSPSEQQWAVIQMKVIARAKLDADEPELVKDRFASLTATRFSGVTDIRWVKRAGRPALAVINGGRA
jgi:hypothetical protein